MKGSWFSILKALKESNPLGGKLVHDVGSKGFSSMATWRDVLDSRITESVKKVAIESTHLSKVTTGAGVMTKDILKADGSHVLFRGSSIRESRLTLLNPHQFSNSYLGRYPPHPCYSRSLTSSSASQSSGQTQQQQPRKDISKVDDPFDDAPTYNIPEKPMTFVEGASYSVVILAGLGFAAAAAYMACKELLFQPKEYKVFGIALERIQNDHQVRARIGSPIKGYGRETRNRAARQQIPNKAWTDESGIERVMVNFIIRGPHGYGDVIADMFKDKEDKKWKFTYLVVDIKSPSPVQLMLESYLPA